jgi:hypothetical protein
MREAQALYELCFSEGATTIFRESRVSDRDDRSSLGLSDPETTDPIDALNIFQLARQRDM